MTGHDEERDVLIIGAGAAGGAIAWSLARRKVDVVCLEQGDWVDPALRPKNFVDWEIRTRRYWSPNPNIRQWPADYPVRSEGEDPVSVFLYNAVGGSTIGYAGNFWRFNPSDFRVRTLDGVGVDWPIGYDDLAPFYAINEREMGVAGLAGDPWSPPREPLPLPPAPLGQHGRKLIAGYEKLGWQWWPTEQALATRPYDGRAGCDLKNFCPFGCPQGALGTVDVTYWRKALRSRRDGVDLRTNARVREITLHPDGRVRGALYYDAHGRLQEVRAKVVVLAAGGVGTPKLLLQSTSPRHPDGHANTSGLVGRNLMVHLQTFVVGRFAEPVAGWRGTWGGTVSTRQFYETDPANDFVRGFVISGCPGWSPLNLALQVAPWGEGHHAAMNTYLNHEVTLFVCGEDLPDPNNRVELDWDQLDGFGLPGVKTIYAMDENGRRLSAAMVGRARELLAAADAVAIRDFGFSPLIGWHLMGTARMGSDPSNSVVDADNRAHDVPNLFIADGSSLATGGGVNPTSTIQAVALRCAERIWERRSEWS
jgi:choline dehydrogenase-like flavoprotein